MHWNIVELAENGRYAKVERGFLVVKDGSNTLGKVILDELAGLVISADQASVSKPLMVRLAEQGIPIIFCGKNYHPISLTLPYSNHHQFTRIFNLQIQLSVPRKKRLWQQLVIQKIRNQRDVLKQLDQPDLPLKRMERLMGEVKSGDPRNCEAQAARLYWRTLMQDGFRRNSKATDLVNSGLNYGYTLVRATCARAVCAAGLQPSLGLHHHNRGNPFCLVDDLMEPFRPLVDQIVAHWPHSGNKQQFTSEHKAELATVLTKDVVIGKVRTPLSNSMQRLAFSLVQSVEEAKSQLELPELLRPKDAQKAG